MLFRSPSCSAICPCRAHYRPQGLTLKLTPHLERVFLHLARDASLSVICAKFNHDLAPSLQIRQLILAYAQCLSRDANRLVEISLLSDPGVPDALAYSFLFRLILDGSCISPSLKEFAQVPQEWAAKVRSVFLVSREEWS